MSNSPYPTAIRQTFNVVIGWFGVAIGIVLVVSGLMARSPHTMAFVGFALAAASFCVMVRPSIRFGADDVVVSNVVREVTLPWPGISHATSKGSLVLHDNDGHKTTVWAIGSQKARGARNADDARLGILPTASLRPMPGTLTQPPRSAGALREALDAETVDNPTDVPTDRRVRWLPLPSALMALALVSVIVAVIG